MYELPYKWDYSRSLHFLQSRGYDNDMLDQFKVVDLTQLLSPEVPTWNGSCGFCLEIKKDYDRVFRVHQMKMHAGIGTHMDAPSHRFQDGGSIADIPVEQLVAPICLIDVSMKAGADYEISLQDFEDHEKEHGLIPPHSLVIGFTGWSRFWNNVEAYRNVDAQGKMHFPAFSAASAELLVKRNVSGIAIDTLSPDCQDSEFTVHKLILGAKKYIIENIADCSKIPPRGSYAVALPLRAEGSTEAPMRIIAFVPRSIAD
jgi:kynurenine formamidase